MLRYLIRILHCSRSICNALLVYLSTCLDIDSPLPKQIQPGTEYSRRHAMAFSSKQRHSYLSLMKSEEQNPVQYHQVFLFVFRDLDSY